MIEIRNNTPIVPYKIKGRTVYVKREDLCIDRISFSKARGIYSHLKKRKESVIGVLDTFHSKAGWAVSVIGRDLGKHVVVFYPKYKGEIKLRPLQRKCQEEKAGVVPLQAGRSAILYHQAKKELKEMHEDSYMMPNALQIPESIEENCGEAFYYTPIKFQKDTIVIISISSGTITAGVMKGFNLTNSNNYFIIHMGYSRSYETVYNKLNKILQPNIAHPGNTRIEMEIIDEGYQYKDFVKIDCPFPCNPYYDLKAWKWLTENIEKLPKNKNILFWNIGA
ncbi:MAG: PLP-dependent lyase/thiolase [Melioribacteraceae bacterium]|jgi:1-aminocyclopropane-1-carboxylate deaminase/D-cysteine desulfhydrase-like pyridoxal-dependent ACC family enzyme|nr:PLP-dependent lyase/thiolase [Melioribacteraceae bacterium]